MSYITGLGQTDFPSILGDDPTQGDFYNLNVQNEFTISSLGLGNAQFGTLVGIDTDQTIQQQIDSLVSITEGKGYWGSFWSSDDQFLTTANTPQIATLDGYDSSNNGIQLYSSAGSGNYNSVIIQNGAIYNIMICFQISSTTSSSALFRTWFRVNGVDIPNSSAGITNKQNNDYNILTYQVLMELAENDVLTLMWASDSTAIHLEALPAQSSPYTCPTSPSIYLSLQQVQYYQDNTAVVNALQAEVDDLSGNFYSFEDTTNNRLNTAEANISTLQGQMATAISDIGTLQGLVAGLVITVAGLSASSIAQGLAITTIQGQITTLQGQVSTLQGQMTTANSKISTLEGKTQNISSATAGTTYMTGLLDVDNINTDNITLNTQISGLGKLNLSSTTGSNSIKSPSTTISSVSGTGGGIYLGGFGDTVYLNGFPLASYIGQQF